jgi:hypothetical protein
MPQMCASSGINNGGTDVNTATGIVGDNNNTTTIATTNCPRLQDLWGTLS